MRNGALITQFPGVTWFVDCTIPGISEILVARRHHAERSIGALICPTTGGKFLSPANPLAIRMLGQFLSVEIQASALGGSGALGLAEALRKATEHAASRRSALAWISTERNWPNIRIAKGFAGLRNFPPVVGQISAPIERSA